ncbi:TPA: DNA-protecting protein DprA [Vibrio parahaemolyticus]|nr:DNA-protecting protein DprA [Vibrio parahaemolyticus]HBB9976253.1 DNA-protecting protein DprA [Vibrio parahaemolyticus]HBC0012562.1 DNA-protecting protein DprA [Vibrio parahaemolyticus]
MISTGTESLLAYRYLKGIGKKYLNELAVSVEETKQPIDSCFEAGRFGSAFSPEEMEVAFAKAKEQISISISFGHTIISRLDEQYPQSLKAVPDAPPILFCAGNINLLHKESITVIGTREPTEHGVTIAEKVTKWFSDNDWVIASGLAKGVDTIAHQACLNAGGETIAVLAHGLEKVYPAQNKELASNIVKNNGLLVTEYGYNSYVGRSNFVERDRIQAALAKAVVLVQSDLVGGSLHASRAIIEYGRYLVVVGQSKRDIANGESKILANMLLTNGIPEEKSQLLKTKESLLGNILLLRDKNYFSEINQQVKAIDFASPHVDMNVNINLF